MTGHAKVIAAMWGTTHLRAFRLRAGRTDGDVIIESVRRGPGVAELGRDRFEDTFFDLVADWLRDESPNELSIVLAGMIGSTLGWRDVGYLPCPVAPGEAGLGEGFMARGRSIHIVRGLACNNAFGEPDLLRGEETEIAGWLAMCPEARDGERLVCVPGTHAKWVRLKDGKVIDFLTSVAGETFAGLRSNGVLVSSDIEPPEEPDAAFLDGVRAAARGDASLIHQLFSVRARRVVGEHDDSAAIQRMSGLIVGADVTAALDRLRSSGHGSGEGPPVTVIGAPGVARGYALALRETETPSDIVDAETAAATGLWAIAQSVQRRVA